jgi:hypothetical protein
LTTRISVAEYFFSIWNYFWKGKIHLCIVKTCLLPKETSSIKVTFVD